MRISISLILIIFLAASGIRSQTNISFSNPEALQILSGSYNPQLYTPATIINNPDSILHGIIHDVSKDTLITYLTKIDSYYNRNSGSDTVSPTKGIGAVRRWIYSKFNEFRVKSGNRLVLTYMNFDLAICGQTHHRNVFAVLPGLDTTDTEVIIVEGHYDTRCEGSCDTACYSPGMEDNGSGTVLVMELARIMSRYAFKHTIIFACVTGEDEGLYGATAFANYMYAQNHKLRAVFNNDVIGGIICGYTSSPPSCPGLNDIDSTHVRIFSYSPGNDSATISAHKQLARYVRMHQEERINPLLNTPMHINIIISEDRTGRSGDHIPFRAKGFTALRFTAQNEHGNGQGIPPDHQHTSGDILGLDLSTPPDSIIDTFFIDMNYLCRNIIMNGVNLGLLAIAPPKPTPAFQPVTGGLLIMLHGADSSYLHFRVGVRSKYSGSLYFDTLITVTGTNQYMLYGYNPAIPHYISVCNVDTQIVESLFCNEFKYSVVGLPEDHANSYGIEVRQNRPNPFTGQTIIDVNASEGKKYDAAFIRVADLNGRIIQLKPIVILLGHNEYTIKQSESTDGPYYYSLLINGKVVFTGKMLVY
jgi:hypothetical protein